MIWYFTFGLTSFLLNAENPAKACFPSWDDWSHVPAPQQYLLVLRLCVDALWARGNSCCQLCLRLVVTTYPPSNLPFFQAEVFCNLAPCFSCFTHSYDFWFNGLDLCVFPLWHNFTPWCSTFIFLHQGAFCLLSVFTGAVQLASVCFIFCCLA